MITLYESNTTSFNNNGLCVLDECISAEVDRELNGKYEATITYPLYTRKIVDKKLVNIANKKAAELTATRIVKMPTPKGSQLFRIYKTEKGLFSITVYLRHICYDLQQCFATSVHIEDKTRIGAIQYLLQNMVSSNSNFYVSGQTTTETHSTTIKAKNGLNAILSTDDTTILDTYGGEYDFDNYNIVARDSIGADNGVLIAYGKNINGITETINTDDLATRLIPKGGSDLYLPEIYVDSSKINNYPVVYTKELDCSDITVSDNGYTEEQAYAKLRERAADEYADGVDIPTYNYDIYLAVLSGSKEYKNYSNLEDVDIGDTVKIKHTKLNIDISARVISYKYDALAKRLTNIELGKYAKTLSGIISSTIQSNTKTNEKINTVNQDLLNAISTATALITGANGGYVVLDPSEKPSRILIMDTADKTTATKVWQWNLNGLGYSSTGINGPYETAMTMDGHIVGKFIDGETINGLEITGATGDFSGEITASLGKIGDWNINHALYSYYDVPNTTERYTVYMQPYSNTSGPDTWIISVQHSTDGGQTATALMKIMGDGRIVAPLLATNGATGTFDTTHGFTKFTLEGGIITSIS